MTHSQKLNDTLSSLGLLPKEGWGSPVEIETRRRIYLTVWAYTYEFMHLSLVSDEMFDAEARKVDLFIDTTRPDLDTWFRENFDPSTGMWVHKHPELDQLRAFIGRVAKANGVDLAEEVEEHRAPSFPAESVGCEDSLVVPERCDGLLPV